MARTKWLQDRTEAERTEDIFYFVKLPTKELDRRLKIAESEMKQIGRRMMEEKGHFSEMAKLGKIERTLRLKHGDIMIALDSVEQVKHGGPLGSAGLPVDHFVKAHLDRLMPDGITPKSLEELSRETGIAMEGRIFTPVGEIKRWDFFKDPEGKQYVETRELTSDGALRYAKINNFLYRQALPELTIIARENLQAQREAMVRESMEAEEKKLLTRLDKGKMIESLQKLADNFRHNIEDPTMRKVLTEDRRFIDSGKYDVLTLIISEIRDGIYDAKPAPKKKGGKK